MHFRSNITCITYLFLFVTGKKTFKSSKRGRQRDPVAGRLRDQMMERSREVRRTSVKHVFKINTQAH